MTSHNINIVIEISSTQIISDHANIIIKIQNKELIAVYLSLSNPYVATAIVSFDKVMEEPFCSPDMDRIKQRGIQNYILIVSVSMFLFLD